MSKYLGIPFAQPPVGDSRFAAPVKYTRSSMLNVSCLQILAASNVTDVGLELINLISNPPDVVYSENCLYLNVWSKPQSGEQQKAVMVYIYGGGFSGGTSSMPIFNGAALADHYRLSILGFPGNPTAQNNLAFLDQRLAIEWVWDNLQTLAEIQQELYYLDNQPVVHQ
ncbi:uncharacterized protein PAC_05683 [Phialocephala subalpina]|uniref:Carboxylesterase type B domain-containing protein n=1 Tax=Phialocephala subalpina TaxID=576137 RepID=A0A1L7WSP8_9HELO|nr:uncharacterized protein PAC_05683 [Phialocephala subalpina]